LQILLFELFDIFDSDSNNLVDYTEFVTGMLIVLSLDVRKKVVLAFMSADLDCDSKLSESEVQSFIGSFLRVIIGLSAFSREEHRAFIHTMAEAAAQQYAENFFAVAKTNADNKIEFEEFWECLTKFPDIAPWFTVMDALCADNSTPSEMQLNESSDRSLKSSVLGDDASSASSGVSTQGSSSQTQAIILPVDAQRSLELGEDTILSLRFLRSVFSSVPMDEVLKKFAEHAVGEGLLDSISFATVIDELIPPSSLQQPDLLNRLMKACFQYLQNDQLIDANEFTSAMYFLCNDKSNDAINLAFHLIDKTEDQLLNRNEFCRFVECVLCLFCASSNIESPPEEVQAFAHEVGSFNTTQFFNLLTRNEFRGMNVPEGQTSFELFLHLSELPAQSIPIFDWLRFVNNLNYRNSVENDAVSTATGASSAPSNSQEPIYSIPIHGSSKVDFHEVDFRNFRFLRKCFDSIDPDTLDKTFSAALNGAQARVRGLSTDGGLLDYQAFHEVMQLLVPVDEISSDDRKLLTFLLDQCFRIFDRDQDGFVDRGEFVRGLQVLLNIDQNKLVALAFMMADADGNNVLTRREMMSFLTNFMQVLVAINSQTTAEATSTQNRHQIQQGSERLTNTFFEAAGICGDSISFEQFQEVVKVHPVPWLSALDVLLSHGLKEDAKRLEVAKGRVGSVRRSSQIVSIPIDDSGDTLELKTYDLAKFSALCGYLRDLTQDQLVKVFYEHSDNGELSRDSFNKCISQLFPVKDQATGETVASHLSLLFNVFSHHKLGKAINLDEFLSGLRLFCTGSNEDKIMFAFTMIDSDGDGHIALWELIKFFRSLFTMLDCVRTISRYPFGPPR